MADPDNPTDPVVPVDTEPEPEPSKTPDQYLYDLIFSTALDLGYTIYDFNPPLGTPYPFVRIGNVQVVPQATKSWLLGNFYVDVDIWGDSTDRRTVSDMAQAVFKAAGTYYKSSSGYALALVPGMSGIQIRTDTTTDQDLWRAMISLTFKLR